MLVLWQLGNAAIGLRKAVGHSSESLANALANVRKYRGESAAQGEKLARLQAESVAREEGLANRLREAESRASAAEERAAAAEKAAAEAAAEKVEAIARAVEANARAGEAEERAREAEGKAQQAAAGAEGAEEKARETEIRAKEAEERAQQAAAGAERAVADFRASDEFRQEVVEGGLEAYVQGFEMCKSRVAAAFQIDIAELEDIQPGMCDEEPAEEQDGEEPALDGHGGDVPPGGHDREAARDGEAAPGEP